LAGVNDGCNIFNVSAPMGVLLGDVNANRLVNSTDTSLVQSQSGKQVTNSNFRDDVNANGLINSTDASITQSKSGTGLLP
jgi:Dockerin type I domain